MGTDDGYGRPDAPLVSYAVLAGAFNLIGAGLVAAARARGDADGRGASFRDVVLVGTATHKLSRLLAKDRVTSFLRAPFTRYTGDGAPGEVEEEPRGSGMQLALGELVVCPYCLGLWVATGFVYGLVLAPRPTRTVATVFSALAVSDALQIAYRTAQDST